MDLQKSFQKLANSNKLSHSYIFFGGQQEKSVEFVSSFASFLENKKWPASHASESVAGDKISSTPLLDFLIVSPDSKNTIGIESVKEASKFLWQSPLKSVKKTLLFNKAHFLTLQAQNALLKITEEPPKHALIFLLLNEPQLLTLPLQSRFQKIYFSRGKGDSEIMTEAKDFLENNKKRRDIIKLVASDSGLLEKFIKSIILELDKDPVKNFQPLKKIIYHWTQISRYNVNKKLQLEACLKCLTG